MKISLALLVAVLVLPLSVVAKSPCAKAYIPLVGFKGAVEARQNGNIVHYSIKIPRTVNQEEYISSILFFESTDLKNYTIRSPFHFREHDETTLIGEFSAKSGHSDSALIVDFAPREGQGCGQFLWLPVKHNQSVDFSSMTEDELKRAGYGFYAD